MTAVTVNVSLKVDLSSDFLSQVNFLFIDFVLSSFFKPSFRISSYLNISNNFYVLKFKNKTIYLHFPSQPHPFKESKIQNPHTAYKVLCEFFSWYSLIPCSPFIYFCFSHIGLCLLLFIVLLLLLFLRVCPSFFLFLKCSFPR